MPLAPYPMGEGKIMAASMRLTPVVIVTGYRPYVTLAIVVLTVEGLPQRLLV